MSSDIDPASGGPPRPTTSSDHPGPPHGKPVRDGDGQAIADAIERALHPDRDEILEDDARHVRAMLHHQLPDLDLPGFGESLEDCGDFTPSALRFCTQCGDTHEFKRNCLRYDCPLHAPYAVRRRAAGSTAGTGVAPKLDALRRYLNAYREPNQRFHHLVLSPPDDYVLESRKPIEYGVELVREMLDELGIQGLVAYHPWRGNDEELGADDRGAWQERLFHQRGWDGDVREELQHSPHFHVIGVAHSVDMTVGELVEEQTGWVLHRIANDDGISIPDDEAMAATVCYTLSHAGIYETDEQRRLAAWMKGPDVNRIQVYEDKAERMKAIVNAAAEETLGILAPDLECKNDIPEEIHLQDDVVDDVGTGAVSIDSWPWPDTLAGRGDLPRDPNLDLPNDSNVDLPGGPKPDVARTPSTSSSGGSSSSSSSEVSEPDPVSCGGHLAHISRAGDYLLDGDWRETAPHVDNLESGYRSYVDFMTTQGLDPIEDAGEQLPEEMDGPPPD